MQLDCWNCGTWVSTWAKGRWKDSSDCGRLKTHVSAQSLSRWTPPSSIPTNVPIYPLFQSDPAAVVPLHKNVDHSLVSGTSVLLIWSGSQAGAQRVWWISFLIREGGLDGYPESGSRATVCDRSPASAVDREKRWVVPSTFSFQTWASETWSWQTTHMEHERGKGKNLLQLCLNLS